MRFSFLFFLPLFILASCSSQVAITRDEEPTKESSAPESKSLPVVAESIPEGSADFAVRSAEVRGTDLVVNLSYSGGCGDHIFELYTNGAIMKSLPPKQAFQLYHNAGSDNCEALVQSESVFDLSEVASPGNNLIILLDGYKGELKMEF